MDGESEEEQESAGTGEEEEDGDESDLVTCRAFSRGGVAEEVGTAPFLVRLCTGRKRGLEDTGSVARLSQGAPRRRCQGGPGGWLPGAGLAARTAVQTAAVTEGRKVCGSGRTGSACWQAWCR